MCVVWFSLLSGVTFSFQLCGMSNLVKFLLGQSILKSPEHTKKNFHFVRKSVETILALGGNEHHKQLSIESKHDEQNNKEEWKRKLNFFFLFVTFLF